MSLEKFTKHIGNANCTCVCIGKYSRGEGVAMSRHIEMAGENGYQLLKTAAGMLRTGAGMSKMGAGMSKNGCMVVWGVTM